MFDVRRSVIIALTVMIVAIGVPIFTVSTYAKISGSSTKKDKEVVSQDTSEKKLAEYVSEDGNWKINYDKEKYFLNDILGDGEIGFNYIGECSGTQAVIISYYKDKMPDEVLYEKTKDIDDSRIERGETSFGKDMYWSHYRHIKPVNEDPAKGDVSYEGFTAIEHNGGTILLDFISHLETDDEKYSNILNAESELINTFELIDHQPQTEYAYFPGTYIREYTEEIGGEEINIKESVILREDHSCEVSTQDTIAGEWTGTKLVMNSDNEYEYTIEGDYLYLNIDGNWIEFMKQ